MKKKNDSITNQKLNIYFVSIIRTVPTKKSLEDVTENLESRVFGVSEYSIHLKC